MNVEELHRWLDPLHPVVDVDGILRAEIIGAKWRKVRWVTWEQAAKDDGDPGATILLGDGDGPEAPGPHLVGDGPELMRSPG